jgi:hypothetical protein
MKKLTQDEILNMTLDDAWDVALAFGDFLAEGGATAQYEFEDVLPYRKSDILLAILHLLENLKEEDIDHTNSKLETIKKTLSTLAMGLECFIPNEKTYKEMLDSKEYIDENFGHEVQKIRDEI